MMTSQEVLAVYEAMVALTERMVLAAGAGDWDGLLVLEKRCAAHVQALKAGEPPPLTGLNRRKKLEIIKKMLADDRKIRDLTMPWMTQLSALINNAGAQRRLASACGAA